MSTQQAVLEKQLIWTTPTPELELALTELAIKMALTEDLGQGDISSNLCIEPQRNITATAVLKESAVVAGLNIAAKVFSQVDAQILFEPILSDGSRITDAPAAIARIEGPARSVLGAERTAINFLQHLSGIATLTRTFVDRVAGTGIKILDTRKTTPGLRALEKQAVVIGGGVNHRFCLASAVLIKDNHIAIAGSIGRAVDMVKSKEPKAKIEVETKTLAEVQEAVQYSARGGVQAIMLDNMSPDMVQAALKLIPASCFVELSGGITLNNIDAYLIKGVDAISIGALTHSAPSIDISLEVEDYGS
jgi:nicotinate-nucleotide pyrophosphorylase (carboxylating)